MLPMHLFKNLSRIFQPFVCTIHASGKTMIPQYVVRAPNKLPKLSPAWLARLIGGVRSMRLMRGGLGGDACSGTEIPTIIDPSATILP